MSGGPETDPTIPWFSANPSLTQATLIAYLDKERPLSEPRWVKTGDVQEWLKSMFGRMFWVAGEAADGWEKKLEVVDPDPVRIPPLISNSNKKTLFTYMTYDLHTMSFFFRHPPFGRFCRLGHRTRIRGRRASVSGSSAHT